MSQLSHLENDAIVSIDEVSSKLKNIDLRRKDAIQLVNEICDLLSRENSEGVEGELEKAFKAFDSDGDGFITSQDLECVLKKLDLWENGMDCRRMIQVYDTNSDGQIDLEEFKIMMNSPP